MEQKEETVQGVGEVVLTANDLKNDMDNGWKLLWNYFTNNVQDDD